MSSHRLKPLSKGKCLEDLKPIFDKKLPPKDIISLCKTAPKLLKAAYDAKQKGCEEDSYIYIMRYLNIVSYIQKSSDYRKKKEQIDSIIIWKSLPRVMELAEQLSASLQKRYAQQFKVQEEGTEKAEAETLPLVMEVKASASVKDVEVPKDKTNGPINSHLEIPSRSYSGLQDSISSMELFKILENEPSNVLIIDARPRNQFSDSHINFNCCINVPEEVLVPGCSAAKLLPKLPTASQSKWEKRLEVDYLVLMDWFSKSSSLRPNSPLHCLQDIILKWDPISKYRSKPLILAGGFEDWLSHYPMLCTNAKPQVPIQDFDDLLHIDDVTYPTLTDETPKFSRATKPSQESSVTSTGLTDGKNLTPNEFVEDSNIIQSKDIASTVDIPISSQVPNIIKATPSVDRSSKIAAVQKYEELEQKRTQGMHDSKELALSMEAKEKELKQLKQRQQDNIDLSDNEKVTLRENEVHLHTQIEELRRSHQEKDEENEFLRKKLLEYESSSLDSRGNETPKSVNITVPLAGDLTNDEKQSIARLRVEPSTPTGNKNLNQPLGSTGMKRSRSSPNIAQLVQDPDEEHRPSEPFIDRNSKPLIQKPQNVEYINRQRNFHEVYGNVKQGLTGLKNLGNSCYMNSILQCISNINVLSLFFCNGKYKDFLNRSRSNPTRGEVAEEVAHVVRNLWLGQYRSIACRDLKSVVGKHMDQFRGCGQQDAHEFLTFLMDWLHNDLKMQKEEIISEALKSTTKKNNEIDAHVGAMNAWDDFKRSHESVMLTIFFVQQVSTVQCSHCSERSMNFEEPTSNLTLLLPSAARCSLSDCLKLYTSKERISGYKCESCNGSHDAMKSIDLCRLPPILIIHLKRFYSDGFYQKRQTFVDFPLLDLDMKDYTLNPKQRYTVYNLCGVSNHYGTLEGGHYTAYCKNGTQWYKFDDQDVSEISPSDVKSANAYILFYAAVK